MSSSAILSGTGLSKTYGDVAAVKGASLAVQSGEFVCLVGKSGCGKTTLLSLLSGLERPSAGTVTLDERNVTASTEDELALFRRGNVGFIFQSFNLIPTLSAWENVALPLFPIRMTDAQRRARATALLEKMEMGHRIDHRPATLSGGEKQRVAIARALVNDPGILLCDEPTGNLDRKTGLQIMDLLCDLNGKGKTVIVVTHDPKISEYAHRIIELEDGRIAS
jgi:putative ABC transport system ATP-binding protein